MDPACLPELVSLPDPLVAERSFTDPVICSRYKFWRVTFWMFWGGTVYVIGWILRCVVSYQTSNLDLFIAQTIFVYAGPPIYSAAAYNLVGRMMGYVPQFAMLNPRRVVYFFVYLGALVEALTSAGAATISKHVDDVSAYKRGGTLIAVAIVLQAVIESTLMAMVATFHYRCSKAGMLPRNVRTVCLTLYGTSTFVILRCAFRAVESFTRFTSPSTCTGVCASITRNEWYLYALETAPMVIFTFWLNLLHPGRYLPRDSKRFLDRDGKTERLGPGWTDNRPTWITLIDPVDLGGSLSGVINHDQFWLDPDRCPVCEDGSFATGTASNVSGRSGVSREEKPAISAV